ncbi:DUF488 family protein [Dehalogenimonas etheniformans]|uniref:DUF488 domain-containing protein n=1 Tax=Dehalogenimonas etheniformans TaxID=1536648 RepID=UPI001392344B|nr:DUF488 domain-containing protein [Dehalogenimonas etheniformans]QNT76969.1 DUF488 domain-containing protein [Dehalogenimonas etheniformans]
MDLPEKTPLEQRKGKNYWNSSHFCSEPDFFTIGYSGHTIQSFINTLKAAGVVTLVDVRYLPVSRFKPAFSKTNLKNALEANGILYSHRPEWGIPREIRAFSIGKQSRGDIWLWYDSNVLPKIAGDNLNVFFNSLEHPVAFMCMELDPTECHRHRIFLGLERIGLGGRDL